MRDSYETTAEQHEEDERRYELQRAADDERFASPDPTVSVASIAVIRTVYEGERALADLFDTPTREEITAELRRGPTARLSLAMSILVRRCEALSKLEARIERREVA